MDRKQIKEHIEEIDGTEIVSENSWMVGFLGEVGTRIDWTGYKNGYVALTEQGEKRFPARFKDGYNDLDRFLSLCGVDIHGGLTYGERHFPGAKSNPILCPMVIGFDVSHYESDKMFGTQEACVAEVKKLMKGLKMVMNERDKLHLLLGL